MSPNTTCEDFLRICAYLLNRAVAQLTGSLKPPVLVEYNRAVSLSGVGASAVEPLWRKLLAARLPSVNVCGNMLAAFAHLSR